MIAPATDEERAVIGACLIAPEAIDDALVILEPGDFADVRHQTAYQAILELHEAGERVDVLSVARAIPSDGALTIDELHALQNATPSISNVAKFATAVADYAVRKRLALIASEVAQLADGKAPSHDAADAVDRARTLLAGIDMPVGNAPPDPDIDSFIAATDVTYDWLIPNVLERRDRMLVTAAEGMGKSLLLRQIAVMTAAGIHPWTIEPIAPRNVLIVDLENSDRLVTRSLSTLRAAAPNLNPQRLRVHCRPQGIDLTTRHDRRWLAQRCAANNAELLVIGPAYRMSAGVSKRGDIGGEDQARTVTNALDELRNSTGVALLMETHAPHGDRGGRDLRPFGSSVWLRWPEFGIGFAADGDRGQYKVTHWRGPRDRRMWPTHIQRGSGGDWPWIPRLPTGTFRPNNTAPPAAQLELEPR